MKKIICTFWFFYLMNIYAQVPNISYISPQNFVIGTEINNLLPENSGGFIPSTKMSLFAGANNSIDGIASKSTFNYLSGICIDSQENIYLADSQNNSIRKINAQGIVSTIAGGNIYEGSFDGNGTNASFYWPSGVVIDSKGNLFITDTNNHKIRKINPQGDVTTFAGKGTIGSNDGNGIEASFNNPYGIAIDNLDNLYIADLFNHKIRKITPLGVVSTLAGSGIQGSIDGLGISASFNFPRSLSVDSIGNLYVGENFRVRKISSNGEVSTFAGSGTQGSIDGTGIEASFQAIFGIVTDKLGNVFLTDNKVRKITPEGVVTSIVGKGAYGSIYGKGLALDKDGNIYVTEPYKILKINLNLDVGIIAGSNIQDDVDGTGTDARFNSLYNLVSDSKGNLFVTDVSNHKIKKITPEGIVSTFAGNGTIGNTDGRASTASFNSPIGIAIDNQDNLYVSDYSNFNIRKITPLGVVSTIAGNGIKGYQDGKGMEASFTNLIGIAIDKSYNVFVVDDQKIRKINELGEVTTFISDGPCDGTINTLCQPRGIAVDDSSNIYVADYFRGIFKISPNGEISNLAGNFFESGFNNGNCNQATFLAPENIAIDSKGNLFITDKVTNIRKINTECIVNAIAGRGSGGVADLIGYDPYISPYGITIDKNDNIYVSNAGYNIIKIQLEEGNFTVKPDLPKGLLFDKISGKISGTPIEISPPTNYSITATNSYGSFTTNLVLSVSSTLDNEHFEVENKIVLMPNPVDNILSIVSDRDIFTQANVYDNQGKCIQSFNIQNNKLDLSILSTGIYFLEIKDSKNNLFKKQFIKK